MPAPHGQATPDEWRRFLLRMTPQEDDFVRDYATLHHLSINTAIVTMIRHHMNPPPRPDTTPPAPAPETVPSGEDFRAAIAQHVAQCPKCTPKYVVCSEGKRLNEEYRATYPPPPAPTAKRAAPAPGGRRPLADKGRPEFLEPIPGQTAITDPDQ